MEQDNQKEQEERKLAALEMIRGESNAASRKWIDVKGSAPGEHFSNASRSAYNLSRRDDYEAGYQEGAMFYYGQYMKAQYEITRLRAMLKVLADGYKEKEEEYRRVDDMESAAAHARLSLMITRHIYPEPKSNTDGTKS